MGVKKIWLVDAGAFAVTDIGAYRVMAKHLESLGLGYPPALDSAQTLGEVLAACNGEYLTDGVASLAKIPNGSVDFCFSNAVLEHIPLGDFPALAAELHRILNPSGVCVHRVDLQDHLGGALNNLRFSESIWEGPLFSRSGFYTNRIRFSTMINLFQKVGFECEVPRKLLWDSLPTPRSALAKPFHSLPSEELRVYGFDVVLRHKSSVTGPVAPQNPTELRVIS
jgi:SAM-dependent methyltransferase